MKKTIGMCCALSLFLPVAAWSSSPSPDATATTVQPAALAPAAPGTAPLPQLSTTTVAFGNVTYGESATQSVVLGNGGTQPLQLTGMEIGGNKDFTTLSHCGTAVAPGAKCSVNITFAPHALGSRAAMLTIRSSAGEMKVTLGGMGCRYLSPSAARFSLPAC